MDVGTANAISSGQWPVSHGLCNWSPEARVLKGNNAGGKRSFESLDKHYDSMNVVLTKCDTPARINSWTFEKDLWPPIYDH